jgi:hypothetical protein
LEIEGFRSRNQEIGSTLRPSWRSPTCASTSPASICWGYSNALSSQVPMAAREEAIRKPGRQKRGKDSRRIPNRELKEAELGFLDAQARCAALDCFKHSIFAAVPGGLKLKRSRSEIRKSTLWRSSSTRASTSIPRRPTRESFGVAFAEEAEPLPQVARAHHRLN